MTSPEGEERGCPLESPPPSSHGAPPPPTAGVQRRGRHPGQPAWPVTSCTKAAIVAHTLPNTPAGQAGPHNSRVVYLSPPLERMEGSQTSTEAPPGRPPPRPQLPPTHLKGFPCEVGPAEFALEVPLGTVVLQVGGQVAAAQLGPTTVGAGHHVEAAGAQVGLDQRGGRRGGEGGHSEARGGPAGTPPFPSPPTPESRRGGSGWLTCKWRMVPLQRQPSSLWMHLMLRLSTWASRSGSG